MKEMYVNLRPEILISSFRIVNLLCCGDFTNITFRQKYLPHGLFSVLYNHIRTSYGHPQDILGNDVLRRSSRRNFKEWAVYIRT